MSSSTTPRRRAGAEPKQAVSAYGLRMALAVLGALVFAALAVWLLMMSGRTAVVTGLGVACVIVAAVAVVDFVVVAVRRRGEVTHPERGPRHKL